MALIPGILPTNTCYGTPQDLLELFAQFLDIPAVALQSKVFFSTTAPTDPASIWIDTNAPTNPILKLYVPGATPSPWKNYIQSVLDNTPGVNAASNDYAVIADTSDSYLLKVTSISSIIGLVPPSAPPNNTVTAIKLDGGQSGSAPIFAVRAWVLYDSSAQSITDDGNVSTVTWTAVGRFTVNFGASLPTANYAIAGGGPRDIGGTGVDPVVVYQYLDSGRSTSSCDIGMRDLGNTLRDSKNASVLFIG